MNDFRYDELTLTDLNKLVEEGIEHEIVGGPTYKPYAGLFFYLVKVSAGQPDGDPHEPAGYDWETAAAAQFDGEEDSTEGERGPRGLRGPGPCPAGEYA